jgi:hypothetical protein
MIERRSNLSIKLYSLAHQSRSLPLLYSSDSNADDLPYWDPSPTGEGGLLMIPFSYDCTDARFNMRGSGWASPKDYFLHLVGSSFSVYRYLRVTETFSLTSYRKTHLTACTPRASGLRGK